MRYRCTYVPLFGHVEHKDSSVCSLVHIQKGSIQWHLGSILECIGMGSGLGMEWNQVMWSWNQVKEKTKLPVLLDLGC